MLLNAVSITHKGLPPVGLHRRRGSEHDTLVTYNKRADHNMDVLGISTHRQTDLRHSVDHAPDECLHGFAEPQRALPRAPQT